MKLSIALLIAIPGLMACVAAGPHPDSLFMDLARERVAQLKDEQTIRAANGPDMCTAEDQIQLLRESLIMLDKHDLTDQPIPEHLINRSYEHRIAVTESCMISRGQAPSQFKGG